MPRRTIAEVGEFGWLSRVLRHRRPGRGTVVGPGHDCAVIRCGTRNCLFTVDALVEGVHFRSGWMTPAQVGRKSFLVNASDVAAMGGRPRFCVVSLETPARYRADDLWALQAGIVAAARRCGADVVGGNLSRSRALSVSIALLADAPKRVVTRGGACAGDAVYVTGTLGDAALGLRGLRSGRGEHAGSPMRRFREPAPRLRAGQWLVAAGIVSAMIDVSDGLVQDLGHICAESGVGAVIETHRVPLSSAYRSLLGARHPLALHGGEDYELLCTVSERNVKRMERHRAKLGCAITRIGVITAQRGIRLVDVAGETVVLAGVGYDHFRRSA